jgi:hypothetical protein
MSDLRTDHREFLSEFIDLYRENQCLWRIKSQDYSDRNKKNLAYEALVEKLREIDLEANKEKVILFLVDQETPRPGVNNLPSEEDIISDEVWKHYFI